MMTPDRRVEVQPIRPSPVALARARRTFNEVEKDKVRIDELVGRPFHEADLTHAEQSIAQFALTNERLLRSKGSRALMDAIFLSDTHERLCNLSDSKLPTPEGIQITDKQKRRLSTGYADSVVAALFSDSVHGYAEYQLAEMEEAEKLAKERKVDVSFVHEDDSLYGDLIRRVYTPASRARLRLGIADAMTYEKAEQIVLSSHRNYYLAVLYSQKELGLEQPSKDEIEEFLDAINALAQSPEIKSEGQEMADIHRRVYVILAAEDIERFWGKDAINELPDDMRTEIEYYRNESSRH